MIMNDSLVNIEKYKTRVVANMFTRKRNLIFHKKAKRYMQIQQSILKIK
jgi:hypothetical protein